MVEVSVNLSEFKNFAKDFDANLRSALRKGLGESAELLIHGAKKNLDEQFNISAHSTAPRSIQVDSDKTTDTSITIGINETICPYAIYLHEGTKEHSIAPKIVNSLHWVDGEQDFFSMGHEVSGITAGKFLYKAAEELKDKIIDTIKEYIRQSLRA